MILRTTIILLSYIILLSCAVSAQQWNGTWSSDFGELRLVDLGEYVVGDYANTGIIIGKKNFDLLQGVYTNSGNQKSGRFTFQSQPGNKFRGSYHWEGSEKLSNWNGQKVRDQANSLTNFTLDGKALTVYPNDRKEYDGVYDSSFGELRLRQKNGILYGDYGKNGIMAGVWNGNHFVGRFTNGGKVGWFRFDFLSKTGDFRGGQWGWLPIKGGGSSWNLNKKVASTPALYQVYKPNPSDGSIEAVDNNNNNNRPNNGGNATPPSRTYPPIATPSAFNPAWASCAVSQQEHVSYVSKVTEDEVARALSDNGWSLVGGVITSESNDPFISLLTTDRLRAYVATRGDDIVICFRGSKASGSITDTSALKTLLNGLTDMRATTERPVFLSPSSMNWGQAQHLKVHAGFNRAYGRLRTPILNAVRGIPNLKQKKLFVFGHSLGGAQATLCALDFGTNMNRKFKGIALMVSGCPRVGDVAFGQYFQNYIGLANRIEIEGDLVPMLPPQAGLPGYKYEHIGKLLFLTNNGNLVEPADIKKRPVRDFEGGVHKNDNYLRVVRDFQRKSQQSGFFNNRTNYLNQAAKAERALR